MPAILSGRADAMLGGFLNVEGVDLRLRGKKPDRDPGRPARHSRPTTSWCWSRTRIALGDETQNVRLFIAALERGTKAAVADPPAATKAVLDAGQGLNPRFTAAEVRKTLPLLLKTGDEPYGYMDPKQWQRFAQFFADHGLIKAAAQHRRRAHQRPAAGEDPALSQSGTARSAAQAAKRSGGPVATALW